ncbi:hypothetical protein BHM03_00015972 [Ensete ventricosum]|nr:hypothetical protein BHM03_00015972 [Ensete ventricosum]
MERPVFDRRGRGKVDLEQGQLTQHGDVRLVTQATCHSKGRSLTHGFIEHRAVSIGPWEPWEVVQRQSKDRKRHARPLYEQPSTNDRDIKYPSRGHYKH